MSNEGQRASREQRRMSAYLWPRVSGSVDRRDGSSTANPLPRVIFASAVIGIVLLLAGDLLARAGAMLAAAAASLLGIAAVCLGLIHMIRDARQRLTAWRERRGRRRRSSE